MRLRKYAEGRILGKARIDWIERRIAFALPGPETAGDTWLLLDCKHGPSIARPLPAPFGEETAWPGIADSAGPAPWKTFPALTPPLRRTLERLDPMDAAALLADLESGKGDLFWYGEKEAPLAVSAWPLEPNPGTWEKALPPRAQTVLPLLESLQMPLLLEHFTRGTPRAEEEKDRKTSQKRARLLANLEQEEKRLRSMARLGDDARLIQAHLWELPAGGFVEELVLPLDPADPGKGSGTIALDRSLSVTENMREMFRKAAKAARGLSMLEKRFAAARGAPAALSAPRTTPLREPANNKGKKPLFSPSLIQEFISSDGIALWRGRNAKGNRALLRLARPFDLWCHAEDGPSAHLLVRRDHAAMETPESTLLEAAALVGLKSRRKNDPKVPVMFALAKHVRPVKGADAGTVRVRETVLALLAAPDPAVEERLLMRHSG